MFSLSSTDENSSPVGISRVAGPMHVINVATRSVEGCLSNPVTISYSFQICNHFFQFAARFTLVSNFYGKLYIGYEPVEDGETLSGGAFA
jgi:hypothetical protein